MLLSVVKDGVPRATETWSKEIEMTSVAEPSAGPYVVVAAWHCSACDVQGRSSTDAEVVCWNCDGQVTITARPSMRLADL